MTLYPPFAQKLRQVPGRVLRDYVSAQDQMTLFLEGVDSLRPWRSPAQYGISAVIEQPDETALVRDADRAGLAIEKLTHPHEYRLTLRMPEDVTVRVLELEHKRHHGVSDGLAAVWSLLDRRGPWA